MPFSSDKSRRAFFYRMGQMANPRTFYDSYSNFNKNTDHEMYSELKNRLYKDPKPLYKKASEDFKKGYPTTIYDILLTDKTMSMKHSWFGADRPYNEFIFETEANKAKEKSKFSKSNRFAELPSQSIDEHYIDVNVDPIKYNTGVIIEEAIRNYDQNKSYYDKYHISKEDLINIELAKNNLLTESESNVQV